MINGASTLSPEHKTTSPEAERRASQWGAVMAGFSLEGPTVRSRLDGEVVDRLGVPVGQEALAAVGSVAVAERYGRSEQDPRWRYGQGRPLDGGPHESQGDPAASALHVGMFGRQPGDEGRPGRQAGVVDMAGPEAIMGGGREVVEELYAQQSRVAHQAARLAEQVAQAPQDEVLRDEADRWVSMRAAVVGDARVEVQTPHGQELPSAVYIHLPDNEGAYWQVSILNPNQPNQQVWVGDRLANESELPIVAEVLTVLGQTGEEEDNEESSRPTPEARGAKQAEGNLDDPDRHEASDTVSGWAALEGYDPAADRQEAGLPPLWQYGGGTAAQTGADYPGPYATTLQYGYDQYTGALSGGWEATARALARAAQRAAQADRTGR